MLTKETAELIFIFIVVSIALIIAFVCPLVSMFKAKNANVNKFTASFPYLEVVVEPHNYNSSETVIFRDFFLLQVILPDVILHSWEYYNAAGENVAGCSGPDSLDTILSYFENLTPTQMDVSFSN